METFSNTDLLEPLQLYKSRLKDAFHANAEKYFDEMVKKGQINEEQNQEYVNKYKKETALAENLDKEIRKKKTARGFAIFFGVLLFVAIIGALLIFITAKRLKQEIEELSKSYDQHAAAAKEALNAAYASIAGLNNQYQWNMAAELMSKTTPLIQLDPIFDAKKYEMLHDKFGFGDYDGPDQSVVFSQSGSILGNPFVFMKTYNQIMTNHVYTGQTVITYTVSVPNGKGGYRTETRTQVLHASYNAPEPTYFYDTWLIYGNDAAPNLSFSRHPTKVNGMNEKEIERYVKRYDKDLDKMVKKSVSNGGSFTRLANEEFEALFNCTDRDNETEFRLLFTPLAQRNFTSLIKDKEIGFGDDFILRKKKKLNYVKSAHQQNSSSLDSDPEALKTYDIKSAKEIFVNYCDKYLKDIFFDLAPLISVPLYQQHKTREYIYQGTFKHHITQAEAESAANSHNVNLFKHPATRSVGTILKSKFLSNAGENSDVCNITGYSFSGTDRVQTVMVMGGDGRLHPVPVPWIEYNQISKDTQIVVGDANTDKSGFEALAQTGKFNDFINKFDKDSDILYKKRLYSFVIKGNNK